MTLPALAQMMEASGYPYTIIVEDILSPEDTAFVFNAFDESPVAQINMTPNDDFTIKSGDIEVTFVDPTDVIMWIVQSV